MTKQSKGEMLSAAIHMAVEAHHGVFDRGGNPYILHCIAVMQLLNTSDEELQCMAMLHDGPEDNKNVTWNLMKEKGMSQRVIEGVKAVTKMPGESYEEYKIKVKSNPDAIKIKMADLTHNSDIRRLKGIRQKDLDRVAEYQKFYFELKALVD